MKSEVQIDGVDETGGSSRIGDEKRREKFKSELKCLSACFKFRECCKLTQSAMEDIESKTCISTFVTWHRKRAHNAATTIIEC